MPLRIFSQTPFELPKLVTAGSTHFGIDVEVLAAPTAFQVRLEVSQPGLYNGEFDMRVRRPNEADFADAERAERAGNTPGMAGLARRCTELWEAFTQGGKEPTLDEPAVLALCSVLTSVALGPALPADCSTLLGVRSSQERLKALLTKG